MFTSFVSMIIFTSCIFTPFANSAWDGFTCARSENNDCVELEIRGALSKWKKGGLGTMLLSGGLAEGKQSPVKVKNISLKKGSITQTVNTIFPKATFSFKLNGKFEELLGDYEVEIPQCSEGQKRTIKFRVEERDANEENPAYATGMLSKYDNYYKKIQGTPLLYYKEFKPRDKGYKEDEPNLRIYLPRGQQKAMISFNDMDSNDMHY
ncbi:hypothetical protein DdX_13010 [Ditylenchus destructor]|uniref:Uncharacterized protein n=1 Tax=Ditylenchus destructor TaxID=166010 RepID=A0AAD4MZK8_9BILA|nr:hypothetical protein DdX_13010 [Ditylenchus destructor]